MTTITKYLFISILICINYLSFGQIKLTSPQERAVYQRNNIGFSAVTIAGNYQKQVDRLEYRLDPIQPNQGETLDWTLLKNLPLNGNFNVIVTMRQGWYKLTVRGVLNGQVLNDVGVVNRVGVGEVFIIAGQSNAEGVGTIGGIGALDDRVNCYNKQNNLEFGGTRNITLSDFTKLDASTAIAPRGPNGWCWGRLGDYLVDRLKVPVMFFNVAFGGTTSDTWARTARGESAYNPYAGTIYQNNLPYKNMSDVLHYFVPQLGIRAVLWCQGESDNYIFNDKQNISSVTYRTNLQTVIDKTRSETGKKELAWVVSLTSANTPNNCPITVCTTAPSDNNIIEGQRAVINTPNNNVFLGPATDGIQNPTRLDGVHFSSVGLSLLADAWNASLSDSFFNNSKPFLPFENADVSFNCGNNQVEVTLPSGNNNYQWSDNSLTFEDGVFSNQQKINLSANPNKQYYARYRNNFGDVIQVPAVNFKGSNIPVASITASGATDFCEGKQVNLKASDATIYEWSNGSKTKEITVTTSGNYSVKTINDFGCQSSFSTPTTIISKPVPPKPTITANSATTFCADSSVTLQSSEQGATSFLWSNGTTSKNLKVNTSGNFTVKVVSNQGCVSPESNAVAVTVNPLPAMPSIVPNGSTTFCADTSVVLTSSNQDAVAYRWSTGTNARNITIRNSGDYSVRTVDKNGCVSLQSLATKVKVNPLPPAPTISSAKDTVFCQGESTILQLNIQNGAFPTFVAFQEGKTTRYNFQNLNVNISGSFIGFQTDVNGCKSGFSPSIYVAVKPTPAKVSNISRLSPYSIGIENSKANTYVWQFNGANRPDFSGTTVRINEAGKYKVIAKNIYKTLSYGEKVCSSEPSDDFTFLLYDDNGISIYPNPSRGFFSIDSKVDWKNSNVEVYSMRGELIQRVFVTVFNDVQKLDLTSLPEGEYMLRIRTDNFYTITKRIIINR
jgi:Carbohydrate esterase, sialic acid-specific acetylesterase/Secretion system C-terminal sorting domain